MTPAGVNFLSFICDVVTRFCTTKRVNEASIRELDSKVAMEAYLREKKEAILKDRKDEMNQTGFGTIEDDQKSNLQQVQEKY